MLPELPGDVHALDVLVVGEARVADQVIAVVDLRKRCGDAEVAALEAVLFRIDSRVIGVPENAQPLDAVMAVEGVILENR